MEEVPNLINICPTNPIQILNQHSFFEDFVWVLQIILPTKNKTKKNSMLALGLHNKDRKSTGDKANINNPKVNRGCTPFTANRTSADCVQISLEPSIQYIPLRVYHARGFNATPEVIKFWSHSTEFPPFPDIWLIEQFLRMCGQTADRIRLKFGGPTHNGSPRGWLTFGYDPQTNFRCFLASDQSGSVHAFANKQNSWSDWGPIWWANSIRVSPGLINFWFMLHWCFAVSWSLIDQAISARLRSSCWLDWTQIWWANV